MKAISLAKQAELDKAFTNIKHPSGALIFRKTTAKQDLNCAQKVNPVRMQPSHWRMPARESDDEDEPAQELSFGSWVERPILERKWRCYDEDT